MVRKGLLTVFITILFMNSTYAEYHKNIKDDIKIYNFDKKIINYIEKSKNPKLRKNKLIQKIENILGKNKSEIFKISQKKYFKNFKEYALIKIYNFLNYGDIINYNPNSVSVLENDYIKIITTNKNIKINNNELYLINKNGNKYKFIEFFKINSNTKTQNFIKNNLKCNILENSNNKIKFTKNEIFYTKDCKYSNNGINYFERISTNVLIYINAGQDYNGVDYSSIEIKNK